MRNPSTKKLDIRFGTADDIEQIILMKFDDQSELVSQHPLDRAMKEMFIRQFNKRWQQQLLDGAKILVARLDHTLIGFISYVEKTASQSTETHMIEISHLYVIPRMRSRKVGRILSRKLIEMFDTYRFIVWLSKCNQQGRRFYEHLGFRPTMKIREEIVRDQHTLSEMEYELLNC